MDICEFRDEYLDDASLVVMNDFVKNKLDEIHRDIYDHDIETNRDAIKMVIEEFSDDHVDDKKEKKSEK